MQHAKAGDIVVNRSDALCRPQLLHAVDAPKSWGGELWLTSTRPEAPARLVAEPGTLAELIASHPEVLGPWSQQLFGSHMPMFAKFIHTRFPRRVHLGFRRAIERADLLNWLEREQDLLRELLPALRISEAQAFAEYSRRYADWASQQALEGWRRADDAATAAALASFVERSFDLAGWLRRVRDNRAVISDALNEIDMAHASGLFLVSAGVVHAIFGLSHQTHPRDRARAGLQTLFGVLADRVRAGASDSELAREIERAGLSRWRNADAAPPKDEAWHPSVVDGIDVLVEPQQTSDTTYSLADFYTPLVWSGDRVRFRKGALDTGISRNDLIKYLAEVEFAITPIDAIHRKPELVVEASCEGALLSRLVDEPTTWPFFTAYQLELTGRFSAAPPAGVFQQLVVTRGRVTLSDEAGTIGELSSHTPAFIPATLAGRYTLLAHEPSSVLLFSVPGARGGAPLVRC